jgi:hypothetical protein
MDLTNQTVALGSNVAFQAEIAGSAPFGYQWFFNGANLPGATNPLVIANAGSAQAGTYQLRVTNAVGSTTSSIASLTVIIPPSITTDLLSQTVAVGSNTTFQVAVAGTGPFSYHWIRNGTDLLSATSNPLTLKNVAYQQAGTYQVIVSNSVGSTASSEASLNVLSPPTIVADLTNQTVVLSSNVTLQAGVTGSGPLSYQWLINGTNLVAADADFLELTNVTQEQAGTYQLVVSNVLATAASSAATLTVLVLTPPTISVDISNQTAMTGSDVCFQLGVSGTNPLSFQWLFNGVNLPGATSNSLNLAKVSLSQAGTYQVIVANPSGSAQSSLVTLDIIEPAPLRISPLANDSFKLSFTGLPAQTYTVLYSTNVNTPWEVLGTTTSDASGLLTYVVTGKASSGFFRIVLP